MDKKLIYDIGSNTGEDTLFYLTQGYRVIAIDADPSIIEGCKKRFKNYGDRAIFLNYAISDTDNTTVDLFLNNDSAKSSLIADVGERQNNFKKIVKVKTITLRTLMEQYGIPYYCKIDIEGYDPVAIKSLKGTSEIPKYISAEAECKSDEDKFSEDGIFDSLDALKGAGYKKFKLVDQTTLSVLDFSDFYISRSKLYYGIIRKLQKMTKMYSAKYTNKLRLNKKYEYDLVFDASGPFAEELDGAWYDYEKAKELYLYHRRAFFKVEANRKYSLWADWHATF
ncbi:MAG TPA: FkbM family methyltransferase [Flavipsychrobacter sp.]|nr:FkbM family methyltransferase [Flavipsychrobacter sp.]